jgi:hypothetical protein
MALPGVSVAWLQGKTRPEVRGNSNRFSGEIFLKSHEIELNVITSLELGVILLQGIRAALFGGLSGSENVPIEVVSYVLSQPVVIEQSPPVWIKLKDVVEAVKKDPRAVGAFVGMLAGYEHPPMMLITVPAGILLVGSAPALTKAIERGLVKVIDAFFEKHQ